MQLLHLQSGMKQFEGVISICFVCTPYFVVSAIADCSESVTIYKEFADIFDGI